MTENLQEDWLDARLREEAGYIDDAGFTAQVVQKLPARPVRNWLRGGILLGLTAAACLLVYILTGGGWFVAEMIARVVLLPLPVIWVSAAAVTLLIMAGGLAAALSKATSRSR